jgi:predicted dehydrogenase
MADRIRWGIAGTGRIATDFATDLALLPEAELVAVGSRSAAGAARFGDQFGVPHRHVGYDRLVADPEVDAIYVAVPHTGHCEVTLAAISAGKAVLCEKPFALNADEATRMADAAAAAGVFLMEAMWVRFLPHLTKVRELLAEGRLGEIRSIVVDRGDVLSAEPDHRVLDPALGGGALLDLGIYPVSLVSMVLGAPDTVAAISTPTVTGVDAQTSALLGYANGAHALVTTTLQARTPNTASITGTKGRLDLSASWARTGPFDLTVLGQPAERFEFTDAGNGLRHQAAEVGRRLLAGDKQSSVMPVDETVSIMRTLDLIRAQIGLVYPSEK